MGLTKFLGKQAKKAAGVVSPTKKVASAIDKTVDALKDDRMTIEASTRITLFGVHIGRADTTFHVTLSDKDES